MDFRGGTQEAGTAKMSDCEYADGSATPNTDPGCQTLEAKYSYTSNGTRLSFTHASTKVTTAFHGIGGPAVAPVTAK